MLVSMREMLEDARKNHYDSRERGYAHYEHRSSCRYEL